MFKDPGLGLGWHARVFAVGILGPRTVMPTFFVNLAVLVVCEMCSKIRFAWGERQKLSHARFSNPQKHFRISPMMTAFFF